MVILEDFNLMSYKFNEEIIIRGNLNEQIY